MKPVALIIRDGWGISPKGLSAAQQEVNAPLLAKLPFHDYLYKNSPQSRLSASGEDVGLPAGQMGNSEVGHLNLGAGRVVMQELVRINEAIRTDSFFENRAFVAACESVRKSNGTMHLMGLIGAGGVHAIDKHLFALIDLCERQRLPR